MLLLSFRPQYVCIQYYLRTTSSFDEYRFIWQFTCCGSTGPQSWIDLNLAAVRSDGRNRPPLCVNCTLADSTCGSYRLNSSTGMPVTFNALNEVRWLGWLLGRHSTSCPPSLHPRAAWTPLRMLYRLRRIQLEVLELPLVFLRCVMSTIIIPRLFYSSRFWLFTAWEWG